MVPPKYISGCIDAKLLNQAMERMLESISDNIESGYQIDIDVVTQHVQDGMTLETFNLLVLNLNRELSTQYKKIGGSYGMVLSYNQGTIH